MNKVEANSTDKKGKRSEDYGALARVHGEMQGVSLEMEMVIMCDMRYGECMTMEAFNRTPKMAVFIWYLVSRFTFYTIYFDAQRHRQHTTSSAFCVG